MSYATEFQDLTPGDYFDTSGATVDNIPFGDMLDSLDYTLIMLDPQGQIQTWNLGAQKTFGYSAAEAIGRHYASLFPPEARDAGVPGEQLAAAGANGLYEEQGWRVGSDGHRFWVRQLTTAVRNEGGQIRGFVHGLRDITAQKRADDQRAFLFKVSAVLGATLDYEATLNTIARSAVPDIADWCTVEILDSESSLRNLALAHANPNKEQLVRDYLAAFPRDEESTRHAIEMIRKGESILMPELPAEMLAAAARRPEDAELIAALQLCSVMTVPLIARGQPLGSISFVTAESGHHYTPADLIFAEEIARRAAMAIDNARLYALAQAETARAEAALETLNEKVAELERSNNELQQFAYVASHDLQEPLRMVASYTQLIAKRYKGKLDADADEFIGYAVDGANRMQRLIVDLLTYSRVSTRGVEFSEVSTEAVLGTALTNLRIAIMENGAQIIHDPLPTVRGDPGQLAQLFQNLIGNAIKFHGDAPPEVRISAKRQGKEWLFTIKDNGIGIDMEYAERIFAIFQRLHSRDEYAGTGIGLAVCKRVVERHGGRIWIESRRGEGTTFFFTIPTYKAQRAGKEATA